jgi:ABC-2 type transport system ATP-binding protein
MKFPILKIQNLRKAFDGNTVLDSLSLEIYPGEFFGVIGASGSGKTTFLHTLIGFHPPDSGEILLRDEEHQKYISVYENIDKVKKKVGFASQVPSFYSKLTVFENLDYFGALYGLPEEARHNNINILLKLVELENARNVFAGNLSGGMQRRLDIACSLIHNPSILMLDEPTSDLDPILGKHIWQLIQKINKMGTTIIVASHHFDEVETVCSRIGIVSKSKMVVGTLNELSSMVSKSQEIHLESYPGNYEKIIKLLNDPNITNKENRGSELVVYTAKPDKVLQKLLTVLSNTEEQLMDVRVNKLSLGEIFSKVTQK